MDPLWLLRQLPNNVVCHVGIRHGFRGTNACVTNQCVGGALALVEAAAAIRADTAEPGPGHGRGRAPAGAPGEPDPKLEAYLDRLIEKIADLVRDHKVEGIADLRDESDRNGMRIVIELKRGEQPEVILNNLYKHTQLQDTFGMIMLAIVNGQPRELGLVDFIKRFIDEAQHLREIEYEWLRDLTPAWREMFCQHPALARPAQMPPAQAAFLPALPADRYWRPSPGNLRSHRRPGPRYRCPVQGHWLR